MTPARVCLLLFTLLPAAAGVFGQEPTGRETPNLQPFDTLMLTFMRQNEVPGAALAVTRNSRLVYARGFGWGDLEQREPVEPDSVFRIASISKPITAVAVLRLIETGKLQLDDHVFKLLDDTPANRPNSKPDRRLADITVRHLLLHAGGWDRSRSFSPMGLKGTTKIATALGVPPPGRPADVIRYMLGEPLDFDPGSRMAYSNFGYLLLGRVIEHVSGQPYEEYVKQEILARADITQMRIGGTAREDRAPKEVTYYDGQNRTKTALFGPREGEQLPLPYARSIEIMDAHGGWIASAVDLVRFASALDVPHHGKILAPDTVRAMFKRPGGLLGFTADGQPKASYYASGWAVRPVGMGRRNTWHTGQIVGTSALLVRRHDGLNWAVLFNTHANPDGKALADLIDPKIHEAADAVAEWPCVNLFPLYE